MSLLKAERKGGIFHLTLNHPPLNILDCALMRELTAALGSVEADDRAVFVRGEGKHFSAGADIKEHLPEKGEEMLSVIRELFLALHGVPVPTVSVVRGACMGGGLELASGCDILIASEKAKLGVPEITLGVMPPLAAVDLPPRIGPARAAEMVYTGRTISGAEAAQYGLALEAVPDEKLDERASALADRLASMSGNALRAAKKALRAADGGKYAEAVGEACRIYLDAVLNSEDGVEGLKSFLEKRKPTWKNR